MPIYEFHCAKCEADSEILVRPSDRASTKCPHCGSTRLTKKFSTFASATAGATPAPKAAPTSCMANAGGCGCGRRGAHRH